MFVVISVHFGDAVDMCDQHNEFSINNENNYQSMFDSPHPFLYTWPYCKYKVYPLSDSIPCQCRSLQIPQNATAEWFLTFENNATDPSRNLIITSALEFYYMLELLSIESDSYGVFDIEMLTDKMMSAKMIRVVDLYRIKFDAFTNNFGKNWPRLEFIEFREGALKNFDFKQYLNVMTSIKWFSIQYVLEIDDSNSSTSDSDMYSFLCDWDEVIAFDVSTTTNTYIPNITECIFKNENLQKLEWANFDGMRNFDIRLLS